jgi:acyl-CoA reductase-like NAD-dependent aldehyde dehydrogenase
MMLYLAATFVTTSGAAMMLAELAMEAGLPKGVLNIVHSTHVWYS